MEALNKFIIMPSTSATTESSSDYVSWSNNETKYLIDLYEKYRSQVGSLEMKNLKKLWETVSKEINKFCNLKVSASNCENRWRVLERGYKKYISNKNKTGRGRKLFEFADEMDRLFQKKKNIYPEILLSSETISEIPNTQTVPSLKSNSQNAETETELDKNTYTPRKGQKNSILNRNKILEKMRQDRLEYYKDRLKIEQKKLELKERQVEALIQRNILIEERNILLENA